MKRFKIEVLRIVVLRKVAMRPERSVALRIVVKNDVTRGHQSQKANGVTTEEGGKDRRRVEEDSPFSLFVSVSQETFLVVTP